MSEAYILALARHLPPSTSRLRLFDVGGAAAATLARLRGDLEITSLDTDLATWTPEPDSADAVTAVGIVLDDDLLRRSLVALRPGGRLIVVDPDRLPSAALVSTLEEAGYVRILVETALDGGDAPGVLVRGEKAHTSADTRERIASVAGREIDADQIDTYSGRYLHLLIRQTPNKPAWALREGESVAWAAAALDGERRVLLAFSSLPKAVEFMQPAVLADRVRDVHKVARFRREIVGAWGLPLLLNPPLAVLEHAPIIFLAVDAAAAEAPEE